MCFYSYTIRYQKLLEVLLFNAVETLLYMPNVLTRFVIVSLYRKIKQLLCNHPRTTLTVVTQKLNVCKIDVDYSKSWFVRISFIRKPFYPKRVFALRRFIQN